MTPRLAPLLTVGLLALPIAASGQTGPFLSDMTGLQYLDGDASVQIQGRAVQELEDIEVYGRNGNMLGEAEGALADAEGTVRALIIEVDTGFLNLGERELVLPVERIASIGVENEELITVLTEDDLNQLPLWSE